MRAVGFVGIALLAIAPGCHEDFDTSRTLPKRGSVGEEMYGVICDRVGAQALREDIAGDSFRNICHRVNGAAFADKVDTSLLPPIGTSEAERLMRAKMIGRIESLARRRGELVRAFDATFPEDQKIPSLALDNSDPLKTCTLQAKKAANGAVEPVPEALSTLVADMLGRMTELYHDGTLPNSTQELSKLVTSFEQSNEAQEAWSRLSKRQGYRPIETALGAMRPIVAYPRLRDLSNATLSLLSADSNPYSLDNKFDKDGKRIPIPGPGHDAFDRLLDASKKELLATQIEAIPEAIVVTKDPQTGVETLSRPRNNLEMMMEAFYAPDDTATGTPKFIVRRDPRGFARMLAPTGEGLPSPFPYSGTADAASRDEFGRALVGGQLAYDYLDTNKTLGARLFDELRPLTDKTMMELTAGTYVSIGKPADIQNSPLVDLVYAAGQVLGDKSADATLAMAKQLFDTKQPQLTRVVSELLKLLDIAKQHPEAKVPAETAFWDDVIEMATEIAQTPGLLEEVLDVFADRAVGENIGKLFSNYGKYRDEISYDVNDLNGRPWNKTTNSKDIPKTEVDRTKPASGLNRSELFRFLKLIHDTNGVTLCNKPNAKLHGKLGSINLTLPLLGGSYKECEVFKIPDLGLFYVGAIVNGSDAATFPTRAAELPRPGVIYLRDDQLRNGQFLGIGKVTTELLEHSSDIHGMWTPPDSQIIAPKPEWMNRLAFFDWNNDNVNAQTRKHIDGLNGQCTATDQSGCLGSSVCPERIIDDPLPNEADAIKTGPDTGKIRGLRTCKNGQYFQQRNPNTIFIFEHFGFYNTIRSLLTPLVRHKKEKLFVELSSKIYKAYVDAAGSAEDCLVSPGVECPRQGLVSYEPLLVEQFASAFVPALSDLVRELKTLQVKTCDAYDAKGICTAPKTVTGLSIVADTTRMLIDPNLNKGLKDRRGNVGTTRNDGKPLAQVTPAYLITNALAAIDKAYGGDEARHDEFRRGRSKMADHFMRSDQGKFMSPVVAKMTPKIIDILRSQLHARCPDPTKPCTWAREELASKAATTLSGPLTQNSLDVLEVLRKDPAARAESEYLIAYMLDTNATNDALANTLASFTDMLQILSDDENLVPLYHVLASGIDGLDAQLALLSRISGKYINREGKEVCSKEIDPNQVLAAALKNVVSPIRDADFKGQSPLEVIMDVIADVNRVDPTESYDGTLAKADYSNISVNVVDFLVNKERGLEQFYEVVRQGTKF